MLVFCSEGRLYYANNLGLLTEIYDGSLGEPERFKFFNISGSSIYSVAMMIGKILYTGTFRENISDDNNWNSLINPREDPPIDL